MSNLCRLTYGRLIAAMLLVAAASSTAFAGFDEGVSAFERKDYEAALRELRAAAQNGDAGADYYLGRMYLMAEGVAADYKQAVRYFRKAAAKGNANAQFYLGVLYYLGEGVSRDYSEAVKWYAAAAEQGDPVAQYYLGVMYASGEGVRRDHVTALMWLDLAAAGGNETAQAFRKLIARTMTPDEISEAGRQSRERMTTPRKLKSDQ